MIRRLLLALLLLLAGAPGAAHLTPNSELTLDIGDYRVQASLTVPVGELRYAEPALSASDGAALRRWAMAHIAARAPDGRPWRIDLIDAHITREAPSDAVFRFGLQPPPGATTRLFALHYSGVIDRLSNHFVLVMLGTDFAGGHFGDSPRMLGALQQGAADLRVDRGPGSGWRGFRGALALGMHHIAEGHDHLLFLITLLLPAPLLARNRRWAAPAGFKQTVRSLAAIVTAFTIGHSLTLIGGAFLGWRLPAPPVEMAIALSILISAVHAWRPIFAGYEAVVAGGFGLVHGLAFATIIAHAGIEPLQKAQSILGFNLGIEAVQLVVVALAAPGLLLLARSRHYDPIRTAMAALAAVAAALWFAERATGHDIAAGRAIDAALGYAPWLLGALALAAVIVWTANRLSSAPRTS
ncbi:hypothetical protein ASE00_04975 [Sphingomonas sp. Root710]|uniref:HupE/UreJ family protein n=1 Tax=Sphingomonas sp. Root710 TaxID=1736594 RepID=UPI0006FF37E0|nr:HupE/UreJ family protein [Sphingomonas sp. Root710]KRB86095.1 hypothetical protein ASE00_04975 [Sphingomonas sp. Root710]